MLIPAKFKVTDQAVLAQFIQDYPLAALAASSADYVNAVHLPVLLSENESGEIRLLSHIAHNNDFLTQVENNQDILLIFNGPHAYISPNFYPSKTKTHKAVPTWNYSVVHVRGKIACHRDRDWIYNVIEAMSAFYEQQSQTTPWSITDAPKDYIEKMIKAVVGIEITVESMVGNFKLSQNKNAEDYSGVLDGLLKSDKMSDQALLDHMKTFNKSTINK